MSEKNNGGKKKKDDLRYLYAGAKLAEAARNLMDIWNSALKEYDEKAKDVNDGEALEKFMESVGKEAMRRYDLSTIIEPLIPEPYRKLAAGLLEAPWGLARKILVGKLNGYEDDMKTSEVITDAILKGILEYL